MPETARYEVNHPDVVGESVDGEALIVHLGNGAYYSSRGTGDAAWQLFAAGATVREAASAVADGRALPDVEAALGRFLDELVSEGLLRPRQADADVVAPALPPAPFSEPVLEKYTDMQDLLLLDPIHEVEAEGWPKARNPATGA